MSHTNFNRHENMDDSTRTEIVRIITDIMTMETDRENAFHLENMLYGMFDGYLYEDVQLYALELSTELCSRVMRVYSICNQYPKIQTTI